MFFNFSLLFKLLFHMYDYIVVHVRVSSQGEITEICAESMCDWYTGFHAWLIYTVQYVNICYFKKENDCEKWILIHVGDMTALFFLLLLQMLVYRYIYTVTATSLHICMNIYDECWWNKSVLYMKSKNMYFNIYTIYQKFWYTMFITEPG